ncbi:hypothetical protein ACQEVF_50700 [Nonomuraea polychroma]|uniref:hypothetical protein n=1 Tax=Nonomuraea polychroma TaxID=46176 RepID=UPI003D89FE6A
MGKVIVIEHLTLDGVMQAPGHLDDKGDAADAVAVLKEEVAENLVVFGSRCSSPPTGRRRVTRGSGTTGRARPG